MWNRADKYKGINRGQDAPLCDLELSLAVAGWVHTNSTTTSIKTRRTWHEMGADGEHTGRRLTTMLRRDGTQTLPSVTWGRRVFKRCTFERLVTEYIVGNERRFR